MDARTRTLQALYSKPTDRPPMSFWQHMPAGANLGSACTAEHVRFFSESGVDFIKVMSDGFRAPFDTDSIKLASDWLNLRPLLGANTYTVEMLARTRGIVDALRGETVIHINIFAPLTLIRRVGDARLAEHIAQNPSAVHHALAVLAEEQAYLAERAVTETGADGCVVCFQGAELNRFTREGFLEFVQPYDMRVLDAANRVSELTIAHFCGWDEWKNRLADWRSYPARAVNWAIYVDGMDLPRGRAYFGNKAVFGGFDNRCGHIKGVLSADDKRVVMEETKRIVGDYREATGSTDGLLIGADCSLPSTFDRRRLLWVREALEM